MGERPLELRDYRGVGDQVVALSGGKTLVFTVQRSQITGLAVYEPGDKVRARLLKPG